MPARGRSEGPAGVVRGHALQIDAGYGPRSVRRPVPPDAVLDMPFRVGVGYRHEPSRRVAHDRGSLCCSAWWGVGGWSPRSTTAEEAERSTTTSATPRHRDD